VKAIDIRESITHGNGIHNQETLSKTVVVVTHVPEEEQVKQNKQEKKLVLLFLSCRVENVQLALLGIHLDNFAIRISRCRIILFHKVAIPFFFEKKKKKKKETTSYSETHMNICVSALFPAPAAPTTITFWRDKTDEAGKKKQRKTKKKKKFPREQLSATTTSYIRRSLDDNIEAFSERNEETEQK
jgi:hypothetical protein